MKKCSTENIYLYDELSPPEQLAVNQHVAGCADCRTLMAQVRACKRLILEVAEQRPQPVNASALTSAIMRAVVSENRESGWLSGLLDKVYLRYAMVTVSLALTVWFVSESQTGLTLSAKRYVSVQAATLRMPSLRDLAQRRQQRTSSLYTCVQRTNCDAPIVTRIKQLKNANNN